MPYGVQWFVLFNLLSESIEMWKMNRLFSEEVLMYSYDAQNDVLFNIVAFATLFLYMWKDLAIFYSSVWRYISYLQRKRGGIFSNLRDAAVAATEVAVEKAKGGIRSKDMTKNAAEGTKTAMQFTEFKLWLINVVLLYVGLTCYSLISIPQ
eukprot:410325_1